MTRYLSSIRKLFGREAGPAPTDGRRLAQELIERGIAAESSGATGEAQEFYRTAIEADPAFAPAHYNLALAQLEAAEPLQAEARFRTALRLRPEFPEAWVGLAEALQALGRDAEALAALEAAIGQRENYVGALFNACVLLRKMSRFEAAEARLREIDLAALFAANRHAEIEIVARQMIQVWPDHGSGWKTLGLVLALQQRFNDALPALRQAVAFLQSDAEAHNTLGAALRAAGRTADAEASFRRALALDPRYLEAYNNLSVVLTDLGRSSEALESCRLALELDPDSYSAHNNRARALQDLGRLPEAEASFRQALKIKPDSPEAHNFLGVALQALGRSDEALASYRRALELDPGYPKAHSNLGSQLHSLGRSSDAEACFRRAMELKPDYHEAHTNLIFLLDFLEGYGTKEQQEERDRWYARHGERFAGSIQPHENQRDPGRRLRIGYVSADFRQHSACSAFAPILLGHDRSEFEVVCYSGVKREDEVTRLLREGVDEWHSTLGVSDAALAEQVRSDRIDILVDLSGHTEGNRLLVFARKPAPVQVTAWGHATGTGVRTIDYFLSDPVLVPQPERGLFAEEVFDLPCWLCYAAPAYLPAVPGLPVLGGEPFTFGCINRVEKISERAIAAWGRILGQVPGSRLLLKDARLGDPGVGKRLLERLGQAGIGPERVSLIGFTPHAEHLKAYHAVDMGLDPFPQNGGVSTAEALWMGVPVVALNGRTLSGRIGASILSALQMQDWVADSEEQYVDIAVAAARDLQGLANARAQLPARMAASVFGDQTRYTRAVEAAYRTMWRRWCAGETRAARG